VLNGKDRLRTRRGSLFQKNTGKETPKSNSASSEKANQWGKTTHRKRRKRYWGDEDGEK